MSASIREVARPKINLTLKVVGRRADGYHEIESLVAFASGAGDIVTLKPGAEPVLCASGPFAPSIVGENLAVRALQRLRESAPQLELGAVTLIKTLPVAAGLGGGSADAAAVLRAVRRLNRMRAREVDWQALAASLGADVPACVDSEPAYMWGIGANIIPVGRLPRLPAVLVNPMVPVPADKSAGVYRTLAAPQASARTAPPMPPGPFAAKAHLLDCMSRHGNDLEAAARSLMPEIERVQSALRGTRGCLLVQVAGSGPTCFGVYTSAGAARVACRKLLAQFPDWWVRRVALGSVS